MHVILPLAVHRHRRQVGAKTANLAILVEHELPVPPFVAISAESTDAFLRGDGEVERGILEDIQSYLPFDRYAVRSSALIEDGKHESYAGQFMTRLDLSFDQVATAIREVATDAERKMGPLKGRFSIIVQRYLPAVWSGVTFTRNPLGGREMVVEYHQGIGEDLVSGRIAPLRKRFYWNEEPSLELPDAGRGIMIWKQIENIFRYPQDIEWCLVGDEWFILQSRPLTSIVRAQHVEALFLDSVLPSNGRFLLQKTEISEIAPRPTPVTFSLLQMLYGKDGPVERVYAKYGIAYRPQDFLRVIGNELFVSREEELATLLPAYDLFVSPDLKPQPARLRGLFRTFRNQRHLQRIHPGVHLERLANELQWHLMSPLPAADSLDQTLAFVLETYRTIFEVNLIAARALQELEAALRSEPISIPAVLSAELFPADEPQLEFTESPRGNSLELMDATPFFKTHFESVHLPEADAWWQSLNESRQAQLKPLIITAKYGNRLREYGRWLTVRIVAFLRDAVHGLAEERGVPPDIAYFLTLSEWLAGGKNLMEADQRQRMYRQFMHFASPDSLMDRCPTESNEQPIGVSPGIASGTLVTLETLASVSGPKILWTRVLTPDLATYFDQIQGIVSGQGGLLSHLSIIARERHIPVVAHCSLEISGITIGQQVTIDGSKGSVV